MTGGSTRNRTEAGSHLNRIHLESLTEESGISPDVMAERGVQSTRGGKYLPEIFSSRQRRRGPGILFTVHRPNGETSFSFRPDKVDPKKPGHKYEQPPKRDGVPGNVLDVHPSCRHLVDRQDVPVIFVEGIKKADSIITAARAAGDDILVVAISGVWNWRTLDDDKNSIVVPDLDDIPLEGRRATVCFDSDILRNPDVQQAGRSLAEELISRGANVFFTFFPDRADGSKNGADDFLASGGTLREMRLLTRPFNLEDFVLVRLTRDEQLRLVVEDLMKTLWSTHWTRSHGLSCSVRDGFIVIMEHIARHGKLVDDGARVRISHGTMQVEGRMSSRTVYKVIEALEAADLGYRDNDGRNPDETGAFVLRAKVRKHGTGQGLEEKATQTVQALYQRALLSRGEFLRWSAPGSRARRGLVKGTTKVRQSAPTPPREYVRRFGKALAADRDAMIKLDAESRWVGIDELGELRGIKNARDLIRRKASPKGRDGRLVVYASYGCIEIDYEARAVRFAPNWRELELKARTEMGELEADERQRNRVRERSRVYHAWVKAGRPNRDPQGSPTEDDMAKAREKRGPDYFRDPAHDKPVSRLAATIHEYLSCNPADAVHEFGWFGGTLWAFGILDKAATVDEVKAALEELGGDSYRRERLEQHRNGAEPPPPRKIVEEPEPVDESLYHPLSCECIDCSAPAPRYVRLAR